MITRPYNPKEIKEFFESIPKDVIETENRKQQAKTKQDYEEFCNALDKNKCSLCGKSLRYVREDNPCLHWLLRPKGANKKRILNKPIRLFP